MSEKGVGKTLRNIDISAFLRVFYFQHKEKRLKKIVQNGPFLQSERSHLASYTSAIMGIDISIKRSV